MLDKIVDYWWYYVNNLKKHEKKLIKYQGFGERSIIEFKNRNDLDWKIVKVILDNLKIIDGIELRQHLRNLVRNHEALFNNEKTFITHFGPAGKSGGIILNQFKHCDSEDRFKVISNSKLNELPEHANIIFLDDFIGTGAQALDYMTPLTYTINDSVKPFLFTICSTNKGLNRIQDAKTKFRVFSSYILNDQDYFLLDETCNKLSLRQKEIVSKINNSMRELGDDFFNLNIPFAFYYSVPDNSLPLLWKDGNEYLSSNGQIKHWYGLTPRNY
jgi:hypothetical protein